MSIESYPSPNGVLTSLIWRKTAAGSETSLSGYDNASQVLSYTPGQEQVYLNGILLVRGSDYTATNGTSITGLTALAADDFVQINCYNNFSVASVPAASITGEVTNTQITSLATTKLTGTITNAQLAGSIANDKLTNSSITINGSAVALGGSVSLAGDIESVTAGTGISGGGSSGAVTITNSMATAIDAKGDLVVGTGADTFSKLGVGANGTVLTAASGEATGLSWATPAAGGMTLISETVASAVSSLSFTGIPSTYKQLLLVWAGIRHSTTGSYFGIRFNNSTNTYYGNCIVAQGTSATTARGLENDAIYVYYYPIRVAPFGNSCSLGATANLTANGMMLIDNYASTTKNKTFNTSFGYYADGEYLSMDLTGTNTDTAAITSIDVVRITGSATFSNVSNTSVRLYGIS
jgi:hypothetical protein